MPPVETMMLLQDAAYYASNGLDEFGNPKVDAAVDKSVRWEEGLGEMLDTDGNPITTHGTIWTNFDVPIHSVFRLGTVASIPNPPNNLVEVVGYSEIPDIKGGKGVHRTRSVTVRRIHQLPTVA